MALATQCQMYARPAEHRCEYHGNAPSHPCKCSPLVQVHELPQHNRAGPIKGVVLQNLHHNFVELVERLLELPRKEFWPRSWPLSERRFKASTMPIGW